MPPSPVLRINDEFHDHNPRRGEKDLISLFWGEKLALDESPEYRTSAINNQSSSNVDMTLSPSQIVSLRRDLNMSIDHHLHIHGKRILSPC